MSEGCNDIEVDADGREDVFLAGSWPLNNIQLANALKLKGYDFHFRYGIAHHNWAQMALDLPESLAWLWRGYDPDRTDEVFEQEASEQAQPLFRVAIANRDAW
jgi:enterochelin esterase family protein